MKNIIIIISMLCFTSITKAQDNWKPNPKYVHHSDTAKKIQSYQCTGTTVKGERCRKKVYVNGGKCSWHINQH